MEANQFKLFIINHSMGNYLFYNYLQDYEIVNNYQNFKKLLSYFFFIFINYFTI